MSPSDLAFLVGNIMLFVGTLWLIRKVIKCRMLLNGYDLFGALITFLGLLCFNIAYLYSSQYMSIGFSLTTVLYWFMVVVFKLKYRNVPA